MKYIFYFLGSTLIVTLTYFYISYPVYISSIENSSYFLSTIKPDFFSKFSEPSPIFPNKENYCLPGYENSDKSLKSKLKAFIDGPCSPIIIIPGLMGTSLMVEINCEELQRENPNIFKKCGWNTCSYWLSYIFSMPKSEYQLWITDLISPLSMFSFFKENSQCFSELIKLEINDNNESNINFMPPKGVKVNWYGNTPNTKEKGECGLASIKDYSGIYHWNCDSEGYGKLSKSFFQLGYINGLTFLAMPYDFRIGIGSNTVIDRLKYSLNFIYNITGKKTNILAHSLGNNYALELFHSMSKNEKNKLISQYIAAGAPFAGTLKALTVALNGFSELNLMDLIGINLQGQKHFIESSSSLYDCFPIDLYNLYKDENWYLDMLKRENEYEMLINGFNIKNFSIDWLPKPTENCGNQLNLNKSCFFQLNDFFLDPIITINNKSYMVSNESIKEILINYGINRNITKSLILYENSLKRIKNKLDNPEVKVAIIFNSVLNTTKSLNYPTNPKVKTDANEFYTEEQLSYGPGDGTILSSSSLIAGIKWAWEYNNNIKYAEQVKIYELCSNYKNTKENLIYEGIPCDCLNYDNVENCKHACFLTDNEFIKLIFKLSINDEKKENEKPKILELDSDTLNNIISECRAQKS